MKAKDKTCENVWAKIFTQLDMKKIRIEHTLYLVEFVLSLPDMFIPVKLVFS